jgi:hypothetical protein
MRRYYQTLLDKEEDKKYKVHVTLCFDLEAKSFDGAIKRAEKITLDDKIGNMAELKSITAIDPEDETLQICSYKVK